MLDLPGHPPPVTYPVSLGSGVTGGARRPRGTLKTTATLRATAKRLSRATCRRTNSAVPSASNRSFACYPNIQGRESQPPIFGRPAGESVAKIWGLTSSFCEDASDALGRRCWWDDGRIDVAERVNYGTRECASYNYCYCETTSRMYLTLGLPPPGVGTPIMKSEA